MRRRTVVQLILLSFLVLTPATSVQTVSGEFVDKLSSPEDQANTVAFTDSSYHNLNGVELAPADISDQNLGNRDIMDPVFVGGFVLLMIFILIILILRRVN
ncbi:MAG: hypothetical protein ABEK59_07700 [Halobacteria archaeon]